MIVPSEIKLNYDQDSILIFGKTNLTISLNSFGKKFTAAVLDYQGYERTFMDSVINLTYSPNEEDQGKWTNLTVNYYFSTGTGSLADRLKIENYVGTRTWKIKYINLEKFNFNFSHKVSTDSVLELFWIKPDKNFDARLTKVMLSFKTDSEFPVFRQNKDTVFYRDAEYVGGEQYYSFNILGTSVWESQNVKYDFPTMNFTDIRLDSLNIFWQKNPFRVKYRLLRDGNETYLGRGSSVTIPQTPLSKEASYSLEYFSPNETVYDYSHRKDVTWAFHGFGMKAYYGICYVPDKDIFFLSRKDNFPNLSTSGVPLPEDDNTYGRSQSLMSNKSGNLKLALDGAVNVLNANNDLIDRFTYNYSYQIDFLTVADNNTIGFFNGTNYVVKNYGSDVSWKEFTFKPHYNDSTRWTYVRGLTLTPDGKYVTCHGDYDFIIYDISDHKTAKSIYTSPYGHAIGNPLNYNELIRLAQGKLGVYSLPDMQLLRSCDISKYETVILLNVDPYSGILAFSSNEYMVFLDNHTMQEVLKLKTDYYMDYSSRLYRKKLFTSYQRVIDLTKYLP